MSDNYTDKQFKHIVFNKMSRDKYHQKLRDGEIQNGEFYITNDAFKDHAGGLDVLDIGQSLYIDETQGLRRWLNGSWVDINDNTRPFYEKLMKATSLNPELICTNAEYESILATSVFNQCGKFVIDTVNGKIRLPKIIYASGTLNISNIGNLNSQRVLIAKKTPTESDPSWYNWYSDGWIEQGGRFGATGSDALTTVTFPKQFKDLLSDVQVNMQWTGDGNAAWQYLNAKNKTTTTFQTVCQSSTYHNWRACGYTLHTPTREDITISFDPLQYYYIQIATGLETVVDIENTVQLNNPYTLGESKYSNIALNNASWLLGGSVVPRTLCPTYYDMILAIYNGEKTIDGITVKHVNDTNITRLDHIIDTENETFTLPTLDGTEDMFTTNISRDAITVTSQITASGVQLTAPYNGWYKFWHAYEENKYIHAYNTNCEIGEEMSPASSGAREYVKVWAYKGNIITLTYNTSTAPEGMFMVAKKPGTLYFYVGETVQNANIINISKYGDMLNRHLVERNGSNNSGYNVYSDGWFEQWGRTSATTSTAIKLSKVMEDNLYNIQITVINGNSDQNWAARDITTTGFTLVDSESMAHTWKVTGYLAKGQY